MPRGCLRCPAPTCDGCKLCCHLHPNHAQRWAPHGCPECRTATTGEKPVGWRQSTFDAFRTATPKESP